MIPETFIKDLVSIVTLLGIIATAVISYLAKYHTQEGNVVIAAVKEDVNGQRHVMEQRIAQLERNLEESVKLATKLALDRAIAEALLSKKESDKPDNHSDKPIQT